MEELYATYKDDIEFLIVYIREAHPEMLREGHKTGVVGRPGDMDQRLILATECVTSFKFTIPMVIDRMEGTVNADYQAAPVRTTITDLDGKVVYYAGPGPFDFNLNKVEKVLKKIVAGEGRLPPRPEPIWGESDGGLRCGLSLDPPEPVLGEEVTVLLFFENKSGEAVDLPVDTEAVLKDLSIQNRKGLSLKIESVPDDSMMGRMMRSGRFGVRPDHIGDGEVFVKEIDGILRSSTEGGLKAAGRFKAMANFTAKESSGNSSRRRRQPQNLWTGTLTSGAFAFEVTLPPPMSCSDCHGEGNYHHEYETDCTLCHSGEPETESFVQDFSSCAQCHPRGETRGRRQIYGEGGEFRMASVHRQGTLEDKHCLVCHDQGQHTMGRVRLVDPANGKATAWTGAEPEFCLSCHNSNPPAGITFPESKGSGYDKSGHLNGNAASLEKKCTACHAVHGSKYPALTLEEGIESPHR